MARINLHIEAEDAADLKLTLAELAGSTLRQMVEDGEVEVVRDEHPGAGVTQDAEPGERQRRTRRTKAQIEADEAAAKTTTGEKPSEPSKTSDDPFATPATPPTSSGSPGSKTSEEPVSKAQVRDAMTTYIETHDAASLTELFKANFKNKDDATQPCARLGDMEESDYARAVELLKA